MSDSQTLPLIAAAPDTMDNILVESHDLAMERSENCVYIKIVVDKYTLGDSCHIWQYFKVSIKLRTLAVLWTHFCVDKTADLSSFMDTFSMSRILPDLGSFVDTFRLSELKITKTADLSSFMDTFRLSELIFIPDVNKTADLCSFIDTFQLSVKSVDKTVDIRSFLTLLYFF